ncbi:DUF2062 domain-containing protein [Sphingomonas sp. 36D10-4-7]|uniref:DUF2062 domain-containing protein n=2 Tax=Sphingomonas corticis TaxID=2722791 RepID=A0ABX1CLZ8_9SPHN|nr:DUF2062 domain-containing protein [Sphingomonas corticis]
MASRPMTAWDRFAAWSRRNLPTRESMENSRLLRPIAHRVLAPELWRFTRRSVPRGVALGMFTGILIPMGQIPASAVLALPFRANVPAAALTTFFTNPLTTPFLFVLYYKVGALLLHVDSAVPGQPLGDAVGAAPSWLDWLIQDVGPATGLGMIVCAVAGAVLGYAVAALGWRAWIARKWRHRHDRHDERLGDARNHD